MTDLWDSYRKCTRIGAQPAVCMPRPCSGGVALGVTVKSPHRSGCVQWNYPRAMRHHHCCLLYRWVNTPEAITPGVTLNLWPLYCEEIWFLNHSYYLITLVHPVPPHVEIELFSILSVVLDRLHSYSAFINVPYNVALIYPQSTASCHAGHWPSGFSVQGRGGTNLADLTHSTSWTSLLINYCSRLVRLSCSSHSNVHFNGFGFPKINVKVDSWLFCSCLV